MKRRKDRLGTYNERVKLFSGFFNAISIGLIGFALLRPIVEGTINVQSLPFAFIAAGLAFHAIAHYILGYLRKDITDDA